MMLRKALLTTALTATLVTAGCEKAADGAFEIDKLEGCVNVSTGVIRSAHLGGCNASEIKVRYTPKDGAKGAKGDTGATGAKGETGATGAKGDTGAAGAQGEPGTAGAAGAAGSKIHSGEADPTNANGANGDYWLNTGSGRLFGPKTEGMWPADSIGLRGTNGSPGSRIHTGAATPPVEIGANGDYYLATDGVFYGPKASGAWPETGTNLKGASGDTGPAGAAGTSVVKVTSDGVVGGFVADDLVTVVVDGACKINFDGGPVSTGASFVVDPLKPVTSAGCDEANYALVRIDKPTAATVTGGA